MDQNQEDSKSPANMLGLPVELIVFIISFLSSVHDRVKLQYVSRTLRFVIERAPSLWSEFVWPYYDSREECCVMCGEHIRVLAFPNYSRAPSTLVEMLQYCSNVQHLSLPSTVVARDNLLNKGLLDPKLRKAIHSEQLRNETSANTRNWSVL